MSVYKYLIFAVLLCGMAGMCFFMHQSVEEFPDNQNKKIIYRFHTEVMVTFYIGQNPAVPIHTSIDALMTDTIEQHSGKLHHLLQLSECHSSISTGNGNLCTELLHPVRFMTGKSGLIESISFEPTVSDDAKRQLTGLVQNLQAPDLSQGVMDLNTSLGNLKTYTSNKDDKGTRRYLNFITFDPQFSNAVVLDSSASWRWLEDVRWIKRFQSEDSFRVSNDWDDTVIKQYVVLHPFDEGPVPDKYRVQDKYQMPKSQAKHSQTNQTENNQLGKTLDEVVAQLSTDGTYKNFDMFMNFLCVDPNLAYNIAEWMHETKYTNDQKAQMLLALAVVATPESKKVLVNIITDLNQEELIRSSATAALLSLRGPLNSGQVNTLINETGTGNSTSSLQQSLIYALGAMANAFPNEEIQNRLMEQLESTSDANRQSAWIEAVGNSADKASLTGILPYAQSPNISVQRSVYSALRNLQSPEATQVLLGAVSQSSDLSLMNMAINSLASQYLTTNDLLTIKSLTTQDLPIQQQHNMVKILKQSETGSVRQEMMDTLLKNTTSRKVAQELLDSGAKPSRSFTKQHINN